MQAVPSKSEGYLRSPRSRRLGPEELEAELDPRLADVWLSVFENWPGELPEELAWFLRMAYVQGYGDALSEQQPGKLLSNLGIPLPARSKSFRPSSRRKGGRR